MNTDSLILRNRLMLYLFMQSVFRTLGSLIQFKAILMLFVEFSLF